MTGTWIQRKKNCMPHTIEYEQSPVGVRVSFTGEVSGAEVVAANDKVCSHEQFPEQKYQLWDFSEADHFNIEKTEFLQVVATDRRAHDINPEVLIALVGTDEFFFHADTFYTMHAAEMGIEQKRFSTVADAYDWIHSLLKVAD